MSSLVLCDLRIPTRDGGERHAIAEWSKAYPGAMQYRVTGGAQARYYATAGEATRAAFTLARRMLRETWREV